MILIDLHIKINTKLCQKFKQLLFFVLFVELNLKKNIFPSEKITPRFSSNKTLAPIISPPFYRVNDGI